MSGIPDMGQHWQAALKKRVIMIPLPENTAAGAASGDSCGVKGCCRVFRQSTRRSYIFRPTPGERKLKTMAGEALLVYAAWFLAWRMGCFAEKGRENYRFWRKDNHIHKLYDTVSQSWQNRILFKKI